MFKNFYILFVVILFMGCAVGGDPEVISNQESVFSRSLTYPNQGNDQIVISIHPFDRGPEFEGWGTSLAWWANVIGGWSDNEKKSEIMDLVFSEENGLGLNIVRYNIGAGNSNLHTNFRVGAEMPTFQPQQGEWDWSTDIAQRWVLDESIKRGVNIIEAFTNSPPVWMTKSGSAAGNNDGSNNLKEEYFDDFADYITEVTTHFSSEWGIEFDSVTPLNEPYSDWWKADNNQEGCFFNRDQQNSILKLLGQSILDKGLSSTHISGPEENNLDDTLTSYNSYDSDVKSIVTQINTHTYEGVNRAELSRLASDENKKLWMSEVGAGGWADPDHNDITSALDLASKITMDMKELRPDAWIYWQVVEDAALDHNWGFIKANFEGSEESWITKQYYGMAHFTKFIKPEYRIIGSGDEKTLAAYNEVSGTLVLVSHNIDSGDLQYSYDLSAFNFETANISAFRTSQSENLSEISINIEEDYISYNLENETITTIEITGLSLNENRIKLEGEAFGSTGSWNDTSSTYDKIFDENSTSFFDSNSGSNSYVGLDLGSNNSDIVNRISFHPRFHNTGRMTGGKFEGSNTAIDSGYTTIYTIDQEPTPSWNTIDIDNTQLYRYMRYITPDGGYCNLSEIEFYSLNDELDSDDNLDGYTVRIASRFSGLYLSAENDNPSAGNNVQQSTDPSSNSSFWIMDENSDGSYSIYLTNGLALDVEGESTSNSGNIEIWRTTGGDNQQWILELDSDGFYQIKGKQSQKYLDVSGRSTADGANIIQYEQTGGSNQDWIIEIIN